MSTKKVESASRATPHNRIADPRWQRLRADVAGPVQDKSGTDSKGPRQAEFRKSTGRPRLTKPRINKGAFERAKLSMMTAKLMRPTHESEDHTVTLKEHAPGLYQVMVKLAPGAWDVDVNAKDVQNRKFRNIYRVTISEGG